MLPQATFPCLSAAAAPASSTPAPTPAQHRCSNTSSAFSASANPNEDWTKISDLAERRRIQNRIAQRNYRKKLKKRLEDLERRAASSSTSPEPKPQELPVQQTSPRHPLPSPASSESELGRKTPDHQGHMFSQSYCDRQLSTSPPPSFSYYPTPTEASAFAGPYATVGPYQTIPTTMTAELPSYAPYLPPIASTYSAVPPIKTEYYSEDDMAATNPFAAGYHLMGGSLDLSQHHAYPDSDAHTPPLSDSLEYSQAGSPDAFLPTTPNSMPRTPPLLAGMLQFAH